jgi:hypothetical protein
VFKFEFVFQGGNPMEIQKVKSMTEIHQDIRHLKLYDGGVLLSPEKLFLDQKLFLVDYSTHDSIHLHSDFVFYSPQVLLNKEGSLELFAILLSTNKGPRSHIMTKFSSLTSSSMPRWMLPWLILKAINSSTTWQPISVWNLLQ